MKATVTLYQCPLVRKCQLTRKIDPLGCKRLVSRLLTVCAQGRVLSTSIPVILLAQYGNTKLQSDSACVAALTKSTSAVIGRLLEQLDARPPGALFDIRDKIAGSFRDHRRQYEFADTAKATDEKSQHWFVCQAGDGHFCERDLD
jgi:hypothetical protein